MPKPSPRVQPDPIAREVDRLLARLPGADPGARLNAAGSIKSPTFPRPAIMVGIARTDQATPTLTRVELLGLWARVLLGVLLGALMTQWPYARDCGFPLLWYLAAVAAVTIAGGWVSFASWTNRSPVAHVIALMLTFWGIVLFAEQLLPRIGYAANQAAWGCSGTHAPAWLARWTTLF
jgi:hypothetical protein